MELADKGLVERAVFGVSESTTGFQGPQELQLALPNVVSQAF